MELGRSGADADVGFAGSGARADFDAGRAQRDLRGHRQRSPNSAAITLGRALTWFAALTRAREAGRRDAIFNLLDPLDGPGRCGGSRPRLRR